MTGDWLLVFGCWFSTTYTLEPTIASRFNTQQAKRFNFQPSESVPKKVLVHGHSEPKPTTKNQLTRFPLHQSPK
jgi:hypothetical protein